MFFAGLNPKHGDKWIIICVQTVRAAGGGEASENHQEPTGSFCTKPTEGQRVPQGETPETFTCKHAAARTEVQLIYYLSLSSQKTLQKLRAKQQWSTECVLDLYNLSYFCRVLSIKLFNLFKSTFCPHVLQNHWRKITKGHWDFKSFNTFLLRKHSGSHSHICIIRNLLLWNKSTTRYYSL